jgi:hypothetical protein
MSKIKIGITLDDVLRAKTKQFGKIYKKYIDDKIDLDSLDISTNDMSKVFNFTSKKEFNKFLYEDYPFEIFGEAETTEKGVDKKLNLWHLSLNDDEEIDNEIELMLCNPMEFNASIGFTYFFLSKIATRVREIFLPKDSVDIWEKCDILITADPKLLNGVPTNKYAIKINTPYNSGIVGKNIYSFNSLNEFLDDKTIIRDIITNINTCLVNVAK